MNFKTRSLLAVSLATILSLSFVTLGGVPQAIADDDEKEDEDEKKKRFHFSKKPDFVSGDCIVTSFAQENLSPEALDELDCKMKAWLDKKGNALKYKIKIIGMELIDSDDNTQDDLNQLHIHKNTLGTTDNPRGPHQLNVFRASF